jgi:hypothetical protein
VKGLIFAKMFIFTGHRRNMNEIRPTVAAIFEKINISRLGRIISLNIPHIRFQSGR